MQIAGNSQTSSLTNVPSQLRGHCDLRPKMPSSDPEWRQTRIYKYIKKDKLVSLIQNKGKKMGLDLQEDDMDIKVSTLLASMIL